MGIVVRRPAALAQGKHLKLQVSSDGPSARVALYPEKCASNVTLDENKNIVPAMCGTGTRCSRAWCVLCTTVYLQQRYILVQILE